jgi:glycosyltransferase involved in cell wall biosynthesis
VSGQVKIAHVTTVDITLRFLLLGQLKRLVEEGYEVTAISAPGPWTQDLERSGIRHVPWSSATRAWNPRVDARAFAELLRIFRRERFDLVHTHNPKPGIMGRIAARIAGVPCVLNTVHGLYATPEDRARKRYPILALERVAAWFSDVELYQSEEDLKWARRIRLVAPSKSVLLGNGTDIEHFDRARVPAARLAALREELDIPEGSLVVGAVGRLVAEKGYRELFDAAHRIRADMPGVRFVVLGEPDLAKADAITVEELEAAREDVIFAGWREDVRDLLALIDIFVLASWREGVPRSAIEAAAMGRALVLTDIRGCREVARDGSALLVPVRDAGRLTSAIGELLTNAAMRDMLGVAARATAEERFDERRICDTLVDQTRRILREKGVSTRVGVGYTTGGDGA